jgi:murein DD-endopeptidase MepM/ murein hydrolase activator NlpD
MVASVIVLSFSSPGALNVSVQSAEPYIQQATVEAAGVMTDDENPSVTVIEDFLNRYKVDESLLSRTASGIVRSARKYDVDPFLIASIMIVESRANLFAISGSDGVGIMQIHLPTWGQQADEEGINLFKIEDNIDFAIRIIKDYIRQFGLWEGVKRYKGWNPDNPTSMVSVSDYTAKVQHIYAERKAPGSQQVSVIGETGLSADLTDQLAAIFSCELDFYVDIHKGDIVRVLGPKEKSAGKIQGAEVFTSHTKHVAVLFGDNYYDTAGQQHACSFLRSPLKFTTLVATGVQRRPRPTVDGALSLLDYMAPIGTPVMAVASGTVVFAGWKSELGEYVEIQHDDGILTGYAHLARIANGVRPGEGVRQGETIGSVGQTGSATSPSLQFRMTREGKLIDPFVPSIQQRPRISGPLLQKYLYRVDEVEEALQGTEGRVLLAHK